MAWVHVILSLELTVGVSIELEVVLTQFLVWTTVSKNNEWSGRRTYGGRCLHAPSTNFHQCNPYEEVLDPLCRTLRVFGRLLLSDFLELLVAESVCTRRLKECCSMLWFWRSRDE